MTGAPCPSIPYDGLLFGAAAGVGFAIAATVLVFGGLGFVIWLFERKNRKLTERVLRENRAHNDRVLKIIKGQKRDGEPQ